jgi:hypothetical protein
MSVHADRMDPVEHSGDWLIPWAVCGKCRAVAHFSWMGGAHDCDGPPDDAVCTVTFGQPETERPLVCGTYFRQRVIQEIIIDGGELAHLLRFMERVADDGEVRQLSVTVRGGGTIEFWADPGSGIFSAPVGHRDPDWDPDD